MMASNDPAMRAIIILGFVCLMAGGSLFFVVAYFTLRWLRWWRANTAAAEAEADRAALQELLSEQERVDLAARRIIMLADTMPPFPTLSASLPTLIPASYLDASDSTEDATIYCPICALEGVTISGLRDADGYYPLPRGLRVLCSEHTARWEQRLEGDTL